MDIQRASDGQSSFVEDVGVNHGGADVFVAQEVLNGSDVVACLKEMRGKGVAEGMTSHRLDDPGEFSGFINGPVQRLFMEMVAAPDP